MKIDVEKDQEFLILAYSLQNNSSNAASAAKYFMSKIMDREVCRDYDYQLGRWVYGLEPVQPKGNKTISEWVVMRSNGRKPISEEKR